jgi:hypothetical protein
MTVNMSVDKPKIMAKVPAIENRSFQAFMHFTILFFIVFFGSL